MDNKAKTKRAIQSNIERAEQRRAQIAKAYDEMQPKSMRRLASMLGVNLSTVQRAVEADRKASADSGEQLLLFASAKD